MNYRLQSDLKTSARFMFHKKSTFNKDSISLQTEKIALDAISDIPGLKIKRDEVYKEYFEKNKIPQILINGTLVTDFNLISQISRLSNSFPTFEAPISDVPKTAFDAFETQDREDIKKYSDELSKSLAQVISDSLEDPNPTEFRYYPKIDKTFKDYSYSVGRLMANYADSRFALPRLFESNGISEYRDSEGKMLEFDKIVALSKQKSIQGFNR